jgi:uncharacterized protein (TIGR03437 family)
MSDDGRIVVYLARPEGTNEQQAFVVDTSTGTHRQITTVESGVETVTLSGDGAVLWVQSGMGGLTKLRVDSGTTTALTGAIRGFRAGNPYQAAAGQPLKLSTFGQSESVRIGDKAAPVLSRGEGWITVQVPWDVRGVVNARMENAATAEWEAADYSFGVYEYLPAAVRSADGGRELIAHQEFDSLVTSDNPARPGEVVHLYATGLGPVNGAVITGQPAGASPLPSLVAPFACMATGLPVPVLYAGLAPGTVGYYQVSLKVPTEAQAGPLEVRCESADYNRFAFGALYAIVPVR